MAQGSGLCPLLHAIWDDCGQSYQLHTPFNIRGRFPRFSSSRCVAAYSTARATKNAASQDQILPSICLQSRCKRPEWSFNHSFSSSILSVDVGITVLQGSQLRSLSVLTTINGENSPLPTFSPVFNNTRTVNNSEYEFISSRFPAPHRSLVSSIKD